MRAPSLVLPFPVLLAPLLLASAGARANPPYPFEFTFSGGQAFGFLGDDAVAAGGWTRHVEDFFHSRYPDRRLVFYNAGVPGDTTGDALERLERDVLERRLDYVLIQFGTWDGGWRSHDPARFRVFQANTGELLDRLRRAKVHPFLMSPPWVDARTHRQRLAEDETYRFRLVPMAEDYNGVMASYGAWLADEAVDRKLRFVDAWSALAAATARERKVNPRFTLVPDGILPDPGGHAVMAAAVIDSLAPDRTDGVGELQLTWTGGDPPWRSRAISGRVAQVSGTQDRLSFLWQPRTLPWALPDEAFIGGRLAQIDERFNRERLQVIGLADGTYELKIAGEPAGTMSASDLARGIDLHLNWERPDYRRARELVRMNEDRHRDCVRPMRELWHRFQTARRAAPDDAARLEALWTELAPKLNALRLTAREREDAIYEAAKPLSRSYELKRIPTAEELKARAQAEKAVAVPAPEP
jgi:lysophospholipase L1-like esterase